MWLFGRKKIMDLTEGRSSKRVASEKVVASEKKSFSPFGSFFSMSENSTNESTNLSSSNEFKENSLESLDAGEKRRRLAIRLKSMTDKLEEVSNQIYLLQQRVELLEKKTNVNQQE